MHNGLSTDHVTFLRQQGPWYNHQPYYWESSPKHSRTPWDPQSSSVGISSVLSINVWWPWKSKTHQVISYPWPRNVSISSILKSLCPKQYTIQCLLTSGWVWQFFVTGPKLLWPLRSPELASPMLPQHGCWSLPQPPVWMTSLSHLRPLGWPTLATRAARNAYHVMVSKSQQQM